MTKYAYLTAIIAAIIGMLVIDASQRLALFRDARRTLVTIAVGLGVFIVWDILGIALGVFFSGHSEYMSGIYIGPEFPIEEIFFLTFLCYFTLIVYALWERRWRPM